MSRILSLREWEKTLDSYEGHKKIKDEQEELLTSLIAAVHHSDKNMVDKLIREGAPLNMSLHGAITPLGAAVENNDIIMTRHLVRRGAVLSSKYGEKGIDAAWYAMLNDYTEIFEFLMEQGAKLILRSNEGNETRLISATKSSNIGAVTFLLNKKVKINEYDALGRTALHYNLMKEPYTPIDVQIGKMLLEFGGNPNAEDNDGIPAHAMANEREKEVLLEGYLLNQLTNEAKLKAEAAMKPEVENVPEEPAIDFSNIAAPRVSKPKRRL